MTNRMHAFRTFLGVMLLPLPVYAQEPAAPVKIYSGEKSQTKTYMHQFVDSPDGTKYAFRYFPGKDQPKGRTDAASPCEIWICNSDLTGHHKAFTSPKGEDGHGSDVIVWVRNDLIYYAGTSYQVSTGKVLWQFDGTGAELPLARMEPVSPNKVYVSIRRHPEKKGWYWLDPSSPKKPSLHLVNNMKDLVDHYKGAWENAEATYIYQNPSDTKLYVVVYDRSLRGEYAFILNPDGTVHSFFGHLNGHVLWYDDETLLAGNGLPSLFNLQGKRVRRLAPRGNHVSVSPDKKWLAADLRDAGSQVRLYRFGSKEYTVINGDVGYFGDYHPSFSRDGKYVFFAGRRARECEGVFRVDISGIIAGNEWKDRSEQTRSGNSPRAAPEE